MEINPIENLLVALVVPYYVYMVLRTWDLFREK